MFPDVAIKAARAACWAARIAGLLLALLFFAFVAGEGLPSRWNPELLTQFLGLFGMAVGLLLAWKWEGLGGAVTLAAFALLLLANRHFVNWAGWSPLIELPAAVGLVHVLCWLSLGGAPRGKLPGAIWLSLGIFVLLCANEMFGNPPLMTRRLPAANIVGAWHSPGDHPGIVLTVAPDGALSGAIDGRPLTGARIEGNRSWFGALMHWRADYVFRGALAGYPAQGLLQVAGPKLQGDVSIQGQIRRFTVTR
jgi:hypothetical protein